MKATLQSHSSPVKYRPDIDGLRAVAVLSVVVFHAFPSQMGGGFIGVDVFFVISGFLISGLIFESLEKGAFSFTQFYVRRILRIFPALILVLSTCFVFGSFALLPDESRQLSKHILAGAGFVSNLVLWGEAGYFDSSADTKPLLHLWSLGIEEQFYILWPLLLWLAWKRGVHLLMVTALVAVLSFFLNVNGIKQDPVAVFYSPQTRFWELLCGSLLAWMVRHEKDLTPALEARIRERGAVAWCLKKINVFKCSDAFSVFGSLLLALGFWRIHKDMAFPGGWALIPVMGTVLIIFAGPEASINRWILSNRLAVAIGLISYPLYLWHWPILSFARIIESEVPSHSLRAAAVLLSVILAWLTYVGVERPIRFGKSGQGKVLALSGIMAFLGCLGLGGYLGEDPIEAPFTQILSESKQNCEGLFSDWAVVTDNSCHFQRKTGNTVALIGDSHAAQLFIGLIETASDKEGFIVFPASCAAPLINISTGQSDRKFREAREDAYTLINRAYDYVERDSHIDTVILAHHPGCSYKDAMDREDPGNKDHKKVLAEGMRRTLKRLIEAKKNVIIVFDNPLLPFEPKLCVRRPLQLTKKAPVCSFPRDEFDRIPAFVEYRAIVEEVIKDFPQVVTVDISQPLCDRAQCYLGREGVLLYRDRSHLNYDGSRYIAPHLLDAIEKARNRI